MPTAALRLAILVGLMLASCNGSKTVDDPIRVLSTPDQSGAAYLDAMHVADSNPTDPAYCAALRRIVVTNFYVVEARRAAYARLYEHDREALKTTLEINLPKLEALEWRAELCDKIASDRWLEMTPGLIRSWAVFEPAWVTLGKDRPERRALAKMYGEDKIVAVLLDEMAKANPITQVNLRTRCWELLLLEGQEDLLRRYLADESAIRKDAMLLDIRAGVVELGVLPRTREEILWLRSMRLKKNAAFWSGAVEAIASLPATRRGTLDMRDVPIILAAHSHRPDLLTMSNAELDSLILADTGGSNRPVFSPDFQGHDGGNSDYFTERFVAQQEKLTFGDRVAMALAIEALRTPAVRAHVFECADRDLADRASEYGGLIDIDSQGRFELVEYPSRTRGNDARYEAPQDLMDHIYVGLFHVHFHAQAYDNRRYAGPHMGDFQFADASGANCLVFTFVDSGRLDVDFYRHHRMVVDLGTISRN